MFQILFQNGSEKYVKQCNTVLQKDNYVKKLEARGIEYNVIGDVSPQLCGCVFSITGMVYKYVRVEGDAQAGNSAEVEVVDEYGNIKTKEVIILWTKETTIDEIRNVARELKRTKLERIKRVWQKI